jgi:hypothetical protein
LLDRISSGVTWRTNEQSRVNAELVSLASTLNGDKETMFRTENSKKIEVTYTTIADTLMMHYPIEERKLKQLGDDDTLRRSLPMYQNAAQIWNNVFLNKNIITVKKDKKSFLDEDDYEEVIAETAKNVSLNVYALLEL